VAVTGAGGNGMVDGLLGLMLRHQAEGNGAAKEKQN
jgi:hypothetical protein